VTYELLFDMQATALAEDLSDRPLLTGLRQRDIATPTIRLVQAMFYACLHTDHPGISFADVKAMVTRHNIHEIWRAVLEAWAAGLAKPKADEAEEGVGPIQGQR